MVGNTADVHYILVGASRYTKVYLDGRSNGMWEGRLCLLRIHGIISHIHGSISHLLSMMIITHLLFIKMQFGTIFICTMRLLPHSFVPDIPGNVSPQQINQRHLSFH